MNDVESRYLLERVHQLEINTSKLEEEKRKAEGQKIKYEREVRILRSELERLKTPPLVVGTIVDVVKDDRVVIKSSTGPRFVVNASQFIKEEDLLPGAQVALNQQTLAVLSVLPSSKDSAVYAMEIIDSPCIEYDDIGGLASQIEELKETVELPLRAPEKFERVGIEPPKGVLLTGPPGTGKTLLAKAVANRTNSTFIRVIGSEFVQKYIGEGARLVRETFKLAKEKSPSIIFIDEIDAIAARRFENGTSGDREVQRTMMQLLAEMDGFNPRGDIKIIGATNRPDILDPAILRPGRFDRIVMVPMPNFEAKREIFLIHTAKMNLLEMDFDRLALLSDGATGADIKAIAMEAGIFAIREDRDAVSMSDFEMGIQKVMGSGEKDRKKELGVMFA
jgi:proteasome regulatory subunit